MTTAYDYDHGVDFAGVDDVDASMSQTDGRQGLAEALGRRLSTRSLWYDDDYGYDLRRFIGTSTPAPIIESGAEDECLKEERVRDIAVVVTRTTTATGNDALQVDITITDDQGPFDYTLLLGPDPETSEMTVEIIRLDV